MNVEFEFIKLNHISEIHKFSEVSALDSTREWNLINAIFVAQLQISVAYFCSIGLYFLV